jgi:hypothetical protein
MTIRTALTVLLSVAAIIFSPLGVAEQMQRFGQYELHYIVIPTTMLKPEIAAEYDISRGKDRALVNVSVLNREKKAINATIIGDSQNLLGQLQDLDFKQVTEGDAIYYLAEIRFADQEVHRIKIEATAPDGKSTLLKFSQKLYWAE